MIVQSNDFKNGEALAREFGCDATGYNPELHWMEAPAKTKSFALVVWDPDAPMGTFYHWFVCNIPTNVSSIARDSVPAGAKQIENDAGTENYVAPCPPSGIHRYYFTVYALDVEKLDCNNKKDFLQQLEKHKIAKAEIMGTFKRK